MRMPGVGMQRQLHAPLAVDKNVARVEVFMEDILAVDVRHP